MTTETGFNKNATILSSLPDKNICNTPRKTPASIQTFMRQILIYILTSVHYSEGITTSEISKFTKKHKRTINPSYIAKYTRILQDHGLIKSKKLESGHLSWYSNLIPDASIITCVDILLAEGIRNKESANQGNKNQHKKAHYQILMKFIINILSSDNQEYTVQQIINILKNKYHVNTTYIRVQDALRCITTGKDSLGKKFTIIKNKKGGIGHYQIVYEKTDLIGKTIDNKTETSQEVSKKKLTNRERIITFLSGDNYTPMRPSKLANLLATRDNTNKKSLEVEISEQIKLGNLKKITQNGDTVIVLKTFEPIEKNVPTNMSDQTSPTLSEVDSSDIVEIQQILTNKINYLLNIKKEYNILLAKFDNLKQENIELINEIDRLKASNNQILKQVKEKFETQVNQLIDDLSQK